MEKLRQLRYREKIVFINEKIQYFNIQPDNKLAKWGLFYAIQTSIESLYGIIAMIIKDIGLHVKDDENNVDSLIRERDLNLDIGNQLKAAKGMRNFIVHQYNGIDENIIWESLPSLKSLIEKWLHEIEEILDEISSEKQD